MQAADEHRTRSCPSSDGEGHAWLPFGLQKLGRPFPKLWREAARTINGQIEKNALENSPCADWFE
jgi:hypothetical protein